MTFNVISIKERIATTALFNTEERAFILDAINDASSPHPPAMKKELWSCGHVAGSMCQECYRLLAARAHELTEEIDQRDERITDLLGALVTISGYLDSTPRVRQLAQKAIDDDKEAERGKPK